VSTFPETVPALLAWRAAREPSAPWLFFEGQSWTLGDVVREVDRYAVGLAERGVAKGDRVAVLLGIRPETLFTWFAANHLGAIAAMLNPAHKQAELVGLFRLMAPRVVVTDEHRALVESALAELAPADRAAIVTPAELPANGEPPHAVVAPDDVCVLIATSGTTGAPKAVMQTHRTYTLTAEAFPSWLGLTSADRLLATLPSFHINAQVYSTMGALACGSLALSRKFSASRFWEEARALGATQFNSVGAMLHILLRTEPRAADREHAIRSCYAALALPEATHRAFEARFGLSLVVGYGMSETTFGTVWPLGAPPRYGTMGRLRQHPRLGEINRARVVAEDGTDTPNGENGELWLANAGTMAGYWRDPVQTRAALDGGWLHTGDVVRRDRDGYFTFVSRKKDVIRRRGENVTAAEIEGVLASFAGVREVAVVGIPSDLGEDDIVAYVAPDPGVTLDVAALTAWARERLADFKVPQTIHVRDALPRTATERIAKHLLV
jgi:crotonobetaine/carnitine-CoA ligase